MSKWAPYGLMDEGIATKDSAPPPPEFQAKQGEVASRLVEMWLEDAPRTFIWLRTLNAILSLNSGEFLIPWYLSLLSGDLDLISSSYANIAKVNGCSKQWVHTKFESSMKDLEQLFPKIAHEIHTIRSTFHGHYKYNRKEKPVGSGHV